MLADWLCLAGFTVQRVWALRRATHASCVGADARVVPTSRDVNCCCVTAYTDATHLAPVSADSCSPITRRGHELPDALVFNPNMDIWSQYLLEERGSSDVGSFSPALTDGLRRLRKEGTRTGLPPRASVIGFLLLMK